MGLFAVYFGETAADFGNEDPLLVIPASTLALRVFISSFAIPAINILARLFTERIGRHVYVQNNHNRSAYYSLGYGPIAFITIFGVPGEPASVFVGFFILLIYFFLVQNRYLCDLVVFQVGGVLLFGHFEQLF
jgi:hypothetical protein